MKIIPVPFEVTKKKGFEIFKTYSESVDAALGEEEYILTAEGGDVTVRGGSEKALFYAKQTFEQLKSGERVQNCTIHDKPKSASVYAF